MKPTTALCTPPFYYLQQMFVDWFIESDKATFNTLECCDSCNQLRAKCHNEGIVEFDWQGIGLHRNTSGCLFVDIVTCNLVSQMEPSFLIIERFFVFSIPDLPTAATMIPCATCGDPLIPFAVAAAKARSNASILETIRAKS